MKRNGFVSSVTIVTVDSWKRAASTMTPPARPRVEGEREDEILDAAIALLLEVGYDRLTMDAVAKRARASKATLYRRWQAKPALVIDALIREKGADHEHVLPDTGSLRGDLLGAFCGPEGMTEGEGTAVLGAVVTAMTADPEFACEFRDKVLGPKIALSQEIFTRAQARGEIPDDLDLEVIGPAMAGILLHRVFVLGLPVDEDMVVRVVDHVILPAVRLEVPAH